MKKLLVNFWSKLCVKTCGTLIWPTVPSGMRSLLAKGLRTSKFRSAHLIVEEGSLVRASHANRHLLTRICSLTISEASHSWNTSFRDGTFIARQSQRKEPTKDWVLPLGPKWWQSAVIVVGDGPENYMHWNAKIVRHMFCQNKCILRFWHISNINQRPDFNTGLSLDLMIQ